MDVGPAVGELPYCLPGAVGASVVDYYYLMGIAARRHHALYPFHEFGEGFAFVVGRDYDGDVHFYCCLKSPPAKGLRGGMLRESIAESTVP